MAARTCCRVLCRAGSLILALRECRPLSDNLVLLLNKKVSLQSSSSAIPGEQSGSSLALPWRIRDGAVSEPCADASLGGDGSMPEHWALMDIDLRKMMRDPGLGCLCVWNQLQSYLSLTDFWSFVCLARQNKLLLGLVFNGSAVTWGQNCSATASGCLLAPPFPPECCSRWLSNPQAFLMKCTNCKSVFFIFFPLSVLFIS